MCLRWTYAALIQNANNSDGCVQLTSNQIDLNITLHESRHLQQMGQPMDKLIVNSIAVGHGECTLIEFIENDEPTFRILVDAGKKFPDRLQLLIPDKKIDLLVLTHVDDDHLGGMSQVVEQFEVSTYWGPCLPAFRRFGWLFHSRVNKGIERADHLEKLLHAKGTTITHPIENFRLRDGSGRLLIEVLNPAARIIHHLLTSRRFDDVKWLFASSPTPMKHLLLAEDATASEEGDAALAGFLSALDAGFVNVDPTILPSMVSPSSSDVDALRNALAKSAETSPEFFGNSILNNTSLVLRITANLDGRHFRRVLVAGDLENWVYLTGKYPNGLHCDIVKAPHHGGRLYLERDVANEEISLWLKARHYIVSANGQHKLPRNIFRDAVRKTGASLFCSNVRSREIIRSPDVTAGTPIEESCHKSHICDSENQHDIRIEMTSVSENASPPPCVQGFASTGAASPIVVLTQRVVEPDEIINRYTSGELIKTTKWIYDTLRLWHKQRVKSHPTGWIRNTISAFRLDELVEEARKKRMFQFAEHPLPAIYYAAKTGKIWLDAPKFRSGISNNDVSIYPWPTEQELRAIFSWANSHIGFIFPFKSDINVVSSPREAMRAVDTSMARAKLEYRFGLPGCLIEEAIWPDIIERMLLKEWFVTVYRNTLTMSPPGELVWATITKGKHALGYTPFDDPALLDEMFQNDFTSSYKQLSPQEVFDENMGRVVFGRVTNDHFWFRTPHILNWPNLYTVNDILHNRNLTAELI